MSPGEVAGAFVAIVTPIGGSAAWIWAQFNKRITGLEKKIEACEAREDAGLERRTVQLTVIALLWQRLDQLEPGSHTLSLAKKLLDDLMTRNLKDQQASPDAPVASA